MTDKTDCILIGIILGVFIMLLIIIAFPADTAHKVCETHPVYSYGTTEFIDMDQMYLTHTTTKICRETKGCLPSTCVHVNTIK